MWRVYIERIFLLFSPYFPLASTLRSNNIKTRALPKEMIIDQYAAKTL